eukprot:TRINITY_DN19969_c0_g1_i1.p1 TRINITY_DN19969_c0_g1~~TRINITY_DN19969_c0_g1_i1.p1  ORF type:complete len:144 (-),score=33.86 TRINITY_DN19969_c0_g1_i1:296-727(-)
MCIRDSFRTEVEYLSSHAWDDLHSAIEDKIDNYWNWTRDSNVFEEATIRQKYHRKRVKELEKEVDTLLGPYPDYEELQKGKFQKIKDRIRFNWVVIWALVGIKTKTRLVEGKAQYLNETFADVEKEILAGEEIVTDVDNDEED